jgi:hypothetical protein
MSRGPEARGGGGPGGGADALHVVRRGDAEVSLASLAADDLP